MWTGSCSIWSSQPTPPNAGEPLLLRKFQIVREQRLVTVQDDIEPYDVTDPETRTSRTIDPGGATARGAHRTVVRERPSNWTVKRRERFTCPPSVMPGPHVLNGDGTGERTAVIRTDTVDGVSSTVHLPNRCPSNRLITFSRHCHSVSQYRSPPQAKADAPLIPEMCIYLLCLVSLSGSLLEYTFPIKQHFPGTKPHAESIGPVRAPGQLDPIMLSETELA